MATVAMRGPALCLRARHANALDFSSEAGPVGVAYGRKKDYVFVVNPAGANGRAGKEWKKMLPYLRTCLSDQCHLREALTSGPAHAVDITREAIREGADAVVAVGGDGTLHEVVNGFFCEGNRTVALDREPGHSTALGLIPLGTGSDFARAFKWNNDPYAAIAQIVRGFKSKLDVGMVVVKGEHHFFVNVTDIHLTAKAGYYSSKYKLFRNFCYVIGALRAFMGHCNRDLKIKVNDGDWEIVQKVTALCIGNAEFFGGGMKITPTANPFSGFLEVVILQDFKWYDFIWHLLDLYKGTHLSVQGVSLRSVKSIEIAEDMFQGNIYMQSDGEFLGYLPVKCSVLPAAIDFFC